MKFSIKKKGYDITEVDDYSLQAEQHLHAQKERINRLKTKVVLLERELETYHEKRDLIMAALTETVKKCEDIERLANQKYDLEIQRLRQFHAKWTEYYDKLIKKFPSIMSSTDDFNDEMDKILAESEWYSDDSSVSPKLDATYKKEAKRIENSQKTVVSQQKSIASQPKPVATQPKPVASQPKPVATQPKVVASQPKPVETQPKVVVSQPKKDPTVTITKVEATQASKASALSPMEKIKKYLDADTQGSEFQPKERAFSLEEALNPKQDLESIMRDLGLLDD